MSCFFILKIVYVCVYKHTQMSTSFVLKNTYAVIKEHL